ncbi:MAG TPA: hypothetical protein VN793_04775 [Acidimicrobiales bacterium]|nr:hypothetical protein [Acidimicrobiales bacterium]
MATIATTMAYTLLWGPLFGHPDWITPGDLWGTFHTSQFVAWGDIGDVYSTGGGLVSLPGISVVLAPVALLVNLLHLSIGFPFGIPHPAAWLVLGPYQAAVGALVLLPLDALAEELGAGRTARLASSVCEAVVLWPVLAIWGHPEDSVAMAFAVWGLLATLRGRWRAAGWLWGLALVMQPLVVLMVPIVFAMAPRRQWPKLALRSALPSAALVVIPLVQSWRQTTTALLKQPNYPTIDHPTPWLSLAPVLSKTHPVRVKHLGQTLLPSGSIHFVIGTVRSVAGETVAAGPGRLIAIGLALLIGVYVRRHRPTHEQVVWLCCVALSLRCVFEAVMNPYYLWPPLAIAFVLVVRSRWRFGLAFVAGAGLTVWSYRHTGPWEWWVPVVLLLGVVVVAALPARTTEHPEVTLADRRTPVGLLEEVGAPA